jgi:hypothetical protein
MIYRSSQVGTAKTCIAKSYFKYHLGLVPKGSNGKNPDLFFGSAVHDAIEIYLQEGIEKANEMLDSLDWPSRTPKTKAIAKILLNLFRLKFKDKMLFTEKYFEIEISKDMTLKGKYDLIAENSSGIYVGEHKTTNPLYLMFKPNDQFISYYIASQVDFDGIDKVVIYNLDPNSMDINMSLVTFCQEEIDAWIKQTETFLHFYQHCVENDIIVKNPGACLNFNRKCPYIELCSSTPSVMKMLIEASFEINEEAKNLSW